MSIKYSVVVPPSTKENGPYLTMLYTWVTLKLALKFALVHHHWYFGYLVGFLQSDCG